MNVEPAIVVLILATVVGLQAWTLKELVDLKISVAKIKEHCRLCKRQEHEEIYE
jgi:hypothetical protein